MFFLLSLACGVDDFETLREAPSPAGCLRHGEEFDVDDDGSREATRLQRDVAWDDRGRLVTDEGSDKNNDAPRFLNDFRRYRYDDEDNVVHSEVWDGIGDAVISDATAVDGTRVLEVALQISDYDPFADAFDPITTQRVAYAWVGGALVGWQVFDEADALLQDWTYREAWDGRTQIEHQAVDLDLDGAPDAERDLAWSARGALVSDRIDDPIGGEVESTYAAELDDLERVVSDETFQGDLLVESCTYEWDGLVQVASECVDFNGSRLRVESTFDADGFLAEQIALGGDAEGPIEAILAYVYTWTCGG